jgi:hypothetical protein
LRPFSSLSYPEQLLGLSNICPVDYRDSFSEGKGMETRKFITHLFWYSVMEKKYFTVFSIYI